jgi:mono/diheme cytochrome c family protein
LICHGGSICGKSYVGLGNSTLDFQAFAEELGKAQGGAGRTPFHFANVRGTSEAGGMAVFLLGFREPDLKLRVKPVDLKLKDDLCEDPPAWWLLKKKKTMYWTGGADARSVRSIMQFMMSPLNPPSVFEREESTFKDIQAFLLSLEPPKYPFPINQGLAKKGEKLFGNHCARCHGTYGENSTYPNKIVPLDEIGTDPKRFYGISKEFGDAYNASWFAKEGSGWFANGFLAKESKGYQAPPLDGLWATAPYFHNGAAPTVYHVLNSKARPKYYTRSFDTDEAAYDKEKLGWKIEVLSQGANPKLPPIEQRKIYDTTLPGRSNSGHTFGDELTDKERFAVIEYLKTL